MSFFDIKCTICGHKMNVYEEQLKGVCTYCGTIVIVGENAKLVAGKSDAELVAMIRNEDDALAVFQSLSDIDAAYALNFLKELPKKMDNPRVFFALFRAWESAEQIETALVFLRAAAKSKKHKNDYYGIANITLAEAYRYGRYNFSKDMNLAFKHYMVASDCPGSAGDAYYGMSEMAYSKECPKEYQDKGFDYMNLAAIAGHQEAMESMARARAQVSSCPYLASGICTKQSHSMMVECYYAKSGLPLTMCIERRK